MNDSYNNFISLLNLYKNKTLIGNYLDYKCCENKFMNQSRKKFNQKERKKKKSKKFWKKEEYLMKKNEYEDKEETK